MKPRVITFIILSCPTHPWEDQRSKNVASSITTSREAACSLKPSFFKKPHTQISNLKSKIQASDAIVAKVESGVLECSTHHGDRFVLNPWEQRCSLKTLPFPWLILEPGRYQSTRTSSQEGGDEEKHIMVTEGGGEGGGHNSLNHYTELRSAYSPNWIISFLKKG